MSNYYQSSTPGWGTNQYRFGPPPQPSFHPQPSWGGRDFYNAHSQGADPTIYDQAWNRARNFSGDSGGVGVGMHEARHWHRRAYGGAGNIAQMQPQEIGHAAAYEAYRSWIHNSSILYEPLGGDVDRQREGLVGLAVAEAARLLQYTGRAPDRYSSSIASNAAAFTASILFAHSRDRHDEHRSRSRSRGVGFSNSSHHPSASDPYALDDDLYRSGHRSRHSSRHSSSRHGSSHSPSRSHHRSHSRSRSPMMQFAGSNHSYGGGVPIPGTSVVVPNYNSGYGMAQGGQYGMPMTAGGVPMQPSYHQGMPMSGVPSSYAGSAHGTPAVLPQTAMSARPRSASMNMGYAPTPYAGTAGMVLPPAPATVYVSSAPKKHKKHRSSHSSSSHHRSRSIEPHYPVMYTSSSRY